MVASNNKDKDKDTCKDVECSNNPCPSYTQRAGKPPIKVGDECCSCEDNNTFFSKETTDSIKQIFIHFSQNLTNVGYYLITVLVMFALIINPLYNTCLNNDDISISDMLGLDLKNIKQFSILNELEILRKKAKTNKLERGLNPGLIIWVKNCMKWNISILIKWFYNTLDYITGNYKNSKNDNDYSLGVAISSTSGGSNGKESCLKDASKYDIYILLVFPIMLLLTFGNMWVTFAGIFSYLYLLYSILNRGYFPHALKPLCRPDSDSKTYNECCSDNENLATSSSIQKLLDILYTPNTITNIFPIWSYFLSCCFYQDKNEEAIFRELKPDNKSNSYVREIVKFLTIVKFSWSSIFSSDCQESINNYKDPNVFKRILSTLKGILTNIPSIFSFFGKIIGFIIAGIADFVVCPIPIPLPIGLGKNYNWGAISIGNNWSLFWIPFLTASFWIRVFNLPEVFRVLLCWFLNIATFIFIIGPALIIYLLVLFVLFLVQWVKNIFNFSHIFENFKTFRKNNTIFLTTVFSILVLLAWSKSFSSADLSDPAIISLMLSLPTAFIITWLGLRFL